MSARRVLLRACLAAVVLSLLIAAAGLAALYGWPAPVPDFASVRSNYTPSDAWLLDRNGEVLDAVRISQRQRRLQWVPLQEVSPALIGAVISGEDRNFWSHAGLDLHSVLGAVRDELIRHRHRGASTITMQLAGLLHARHATQGLDAWIWKLQQVREARALERHWSKPQILEAYLNLLDYRGELQGIGAAARQLSGRTPGGLTLAQSAALAALLPQPGANAAQLIQRACARARALRPAPDRAAVREAVLAMSNTSVPTTSAGLAPQLAHALLRKPGQQLATTLDARLQRIAIRVLHDRLTELADHNARDGAALIIDNASGEVLAYVGSGGPASRAAQVDGVRAARQAGSTLKPFLYELALERHYLTAASLLLDAPLSLQTASGVYIPQDYDHDFKGLTSVRTALASSLNVPAVRTLVLTGVDSFRDRLLALGYGHITQDSQFYGYSLALGSAEVTLWEQAQAYHALARGGVWSPLHLTRGERPATPLLDPGATFIVGDILSDPAARAVTFGLDNHLATEFWSAVKTGTSEDMRDNWCVGFSRDFTVAVWVGNFEGDSMRDVSGVTGAAPIWHDLLSAAQEARPSAAPAPPAGVSTRPTQFAQRIEPARHEWYLAGTAVPGTVVPVPDQDRPGIASPANGMIIALDPDIPAQHQRILISVRGTRPGMMLALNDQPFGAAAAQQLWSPQSGAWYLSLQDANGRTLDRVLFTVR
jgi:penicillin-binding protein 1C